MKTVRESFKDYMKIEKENILHILFPARCPICDKVLFTSLFFEAEFVCPSCRKLPEYVEEPVCKKCGKQLEEERREYCCDCNRQVRHFIQGKALWLYQDPVKHSIYRFKYQNRREYARYYGSEIVRVYGGWIQRCRIDGIVPIPLHKNRKRQRGYNQAELLAREISIKLNIPLYPEFLIRSKNTSAQKALNEVERKNNLKRAFKTEKNKVQLRHILLVDDIYTTGSTMNEAALELKRAGVEYVYCISICIGKGY